jgi:hypothetical protein
MARNLYFTQGTKGEQNLVQDLIDEHIKIYGIECYYIPRKIYEDKLWKDIYYSEFKDSYLIEMYLENFEGFGGKGDMLSKFGLKVSDEISLTVSRRRWKDFVDLSTNKIVQGRPNDGDLIFFPLNQNVFEIKFVENQSPFYQLNKLYIYTLTCEMFEYGDSIFDTGNAQIDNLDKESGDYPIILNIGGTGNFTPGEKIVGSKFTATASGVLVGNYLGTITITSSGAGYVNPPVVSVYSAQGNFIDTGSCTISGGRVTSITGPTAIYTFSGVPSILLGASPQDSTASVGTWDPDNRTVTVVYAKGNFADGELIRGETSNAAWNVSSTDDIDISVGTDYSENRQIENAGNLLVDFSESNPFGNFGDMEEFF